MVQVGGRVEISNSTLDMSQFEIYISFPRETLEKIVG